MGVGGRCFSAQSMCVLLDTKQKGRPLHIAHRTSHPVRISRQTQSPQVKSKQNKQNKTNKTIPFTISPANLPRNFFCTDWKSHHDKPDKENPQAQDPILKSQDHAQFSQTPNRYRILPQTTKTAIPSYQILDSFSLLFVLCLETPLFDE